MYGYILELHIQTKLTCNDEECNYYGTTDIGGITIDITLDAG